MTQLQIKNIFLIILSCLLFFVELFLFALMQQHQIYLLLIFFIAVVVQHPQKRTLLVPLLSLSVMSYLDIHVFGWCLVYLMPTMVLANYLDQHLRIKIIIPYMLLIFALVLSMVLGCIWYDIAITLYKATETIGYNILILTLFLHIGSFFEQKIETSSYFKTL